MHEAAVLRDLVRAADEAAQRAGLHRVSRVRLRVGALSHLTVEGLRVGWRDAAVGTNVAGAQLDVTASDDLDDPHGEEVRLVAIDGDDDAEVSSSPPGASPG